jgi:cytochrome c biogenesis protein CcdA
MAAQRARSAGTALVNHHTVKGGIMALVGILITFAGFLLSASSVGITSSNSTRLIIVLVGIVLSLIGIVGVINPAYQKNAVWKK